VEVADAIRYLLSMGQSVTIDGLWAHSKRL